MNNNEKWKAYDLATFRLGIMVSHYAGLIQAEQHKPTPDQAQVSKWVALQDQITAEDLTLSVDDAAEAERINSTYSSVVKEILPPR